MTPPQPESPSFLAETPPPDPLGPHTCLVLSVLASALNSVSLSVRGGEAVVANH